MILTKTATGLQCESGRFYTFASDYIYFSPLGYEVISSSQALFEIAEGIMFMDLTMVIDGITFKNIDVLMQYVTTPI